MCARDYSFNTEITGKETRFDWLIDTREARLVHSSLFMMNLPRNLFSRHTRCGGGWCTGSCKSFTLSTDMRWNGV